MRRGIRFVDDDRRVDRLPFDEPLVEPLQDRALYEPKPVRLFHRDDVSDAGRVGAVDAPDECLAVRKRHHARYGACH